MVAELERRAKAFDGATVLEYAIDWVGSGKTLTELADSISRRLKQGDEYITRHMVSRYLNGLPGGAQALNAARSEGAHGLADSGVKIVDDAEGGDREAIAAAKARADFRLRMAGFWNKPEYAAQQKGEVNVNFRLGDMHLDALRRRAVQGRVETPTALPSGEPDVETVIE